MDVRPILNYDDHDMALREIEGLMGAQGGSPDGERRDVLVTLVETNEARHWPVDEPDPIEAIRFMMEQKGLTRRDLESAIGGSGR
jgi:HTH-type transcriptional regulator/antitoxin HigA